MLFALSILASTVQTEDREDETGSGSLRKKRAHQIQPYRGTRGGPRRSAARAAAGGGARPRDAPARDYIRGEPSTDRSWTAWNHSDMRRKGGEGGRDGGCNLHLLARLRVAPLPGSPLLGVEGPEPHERHLVAISNRLDDHVERGREDGAGHLLGDASAGRDGVNQVALGHRHPHRAPRSNVATPRSRRRPESLRAREERAEHRRQPHHGDRKRRKPKGG